VSSCDLLVVAAFQPELDPLAERMGGPIGRLGPYAVEVAAVGIGAVAAGAGTASRLERSRPRAVVMVGTCGALPGSGSGLAKGIAIGRVVVARRALLVEPAVLQGLAAFPEPMTTALDCDPAMTEGLAAIGAARADVATTLAVTTDDALSQRIALATSCSVEHLEAFAAATACASFGVPFTAVLAVANAVGSRGRNEWRQHHHAAAAGAIDVLVRWADAGARGLDIASQ
jgi:futalosine hydrolase